MPLTVRDKCIISGHLKTTSLSLNRVASCFDQIRGHASIRHRLSIPVLSLVLSPLHNAPDILHAYFRSSGTIGRKKIARHAKTEPSLSNDLLHSRFPFPFRISMYLNFSASTSSLKKRKGKKRNHGRIIAKFYIDGLQVHDFEYTI